MNGYLSGGTCCVRSPAKNVESMEDDPCRSELPKVLPSALQNGSGESTWMDEQDEKAAEESLAMYCKPVELYNIIQRRCSQQPLFLQRCLSYKIQAARQRRIRMTLSVTGYQDGSGQAWGNIGRLNGRKHDLGSQVQDSRLHTVFVNVTSPVSSGEGQVAYRLSETKCLKIGAGISLSLQNGPQSGVFFILPELRKLVQNAKHGDIVLFIISDSPDVNSRKEFYGRPLVNCSGAVTWGKLALSSLCLSWLRNSKESPSASGLDGCTVETSSRVDLRPGKLQYEDITGGCIIKLTPVVRDHMDRSLGARNVSPASCCHRMHKLEVQLQVSVSGGEVGETVDKGKSPNGHVSKAPLPYSLAHAWRPRVGRVVFHYLYYHNLLRKTEVTEEFSCPFCLLPCSSFKGLRCHLLSSHDHFNFEFLVSGDLQVVNVTCLSDVLGPQGKVRDVDGLSDAHRKHFIWSFPGRRRRVQKGIKEELADIDDGHTLRDMGDEETDQIAAVSQMQTSLLVFQQDTGGLDANDVPTFPANDFEMQQQRTDLSENGAVIPSSNGTSFPAPKETALDGTRRKEPKYVERMLIQDPRGRNGRISDADGGPIQVVKQRSLPAQKRQRIKGVLGERAHSRPHLSVANGAACAAAAAAPLEDCGQQQQGLSVPNKTGTERGDLSRNQHLLHKRQYFHSHTAQPMDAEQLFGDRDSEDEVDTVIADFEDRRMLDDFVDVTVEEKEVMHLWNSFVRQNRVLADGHCPWACDAFSKLYAEQFSRSMGLRRCLMLFLVKLWNHHLVDGATIDRCLTIVDSYQPNESKQ